MDDVTANLYNIVTVQNIDSQDFEFKHNNVPYLLRKGEIKNFPKFIAVLAVKHLIDRILNKEDPTGKSIVNAQKRAELAGRIVLKEDSYTRPDAPTDADIISEMNKESDLDKALKNPREVADAEMTEEAPPKISTKAGLMEYAKNVLGMNTEDPETKEAFAKMTFMQLKKELDYKE